jgi:hypothetical protein
MVNYLQGVRMSILQNRHDKIIMHFQELHGKHPYQQNKPGEDFEHHHIIPRHANGNNTKENLVWLPYRWHRLIHVLRAKITRHPKDVHAAAMMSGQTLQGKKLRQLKAQIQGRRNVESGHLAALRTTEHQAYAGSIGGKTNKGRKHTDAAKQKVSEFLQGTIWWNNGSINRRSKTQPEGFVKGRIWYR